MLVNFNGELLTLAEAKVCVADRGLLLGDGLFETIRVQKKQPLYLSAHWKRLVESAKRIALDLPFTKTIFKEMLMELIKARQSEEAGIRVTITRGRGQRGLLPAGIQDPSFFIQAFNLSDMSKPYRLNYSKIRRNETSPLTYLKTLSYMDNIMIKKEAMEAGFDDGLCLNTKGRITETSVCNFFLIKSGCILTPPVSDGILPGIMRDKIQAFCRDVGLPFKILSLQPQMITNDCGAFISNVLIGVKHVDFIHTHSMKMTELFERLSKQFYS